MKKATRSEEQDSQSHGQATHLGTLKDDQGREHQGVATYYLGACSVEVSP